VRIAVLFPDITPARIACRDFPEPVGASNDRNRWSDPNHVMMAEKTCSCPGYHEVNADRPASWEGGGSKETMRRVNLSTC
jgi:hypothetical protein